MTEQNMAGDVAAANQAIRDLYVKIGERIKEAREQRTIGASQLAGHVGMSRTSLSNIESGRQRISLHMLVALTQALGVSLTDFLAFDDDLPALGLPPVPVDLAPLAMTLKSARQALDSAITAVEATAGPEPAHDDPAPDEP